MASGTFIHGRRMIASGDVMLASAVSSATATLTFGDTEWNDVNNGTLTLISTDGTSRTYTIRHDAGASTNIQFNAGASADVAAENLRLAVVHADGHNGKITVVRDGAKLTFTQATAGAEGNTTITTAASFDNTTDVNIAAAFAGGTGSSTTGGSGFPKLYAMLYNTTSTITGADPSGAGTNLGFNDTAILDLADFSTLGEYLPGDSSSSSTRQAINFGFLENSSSGWVESFVATSAMGSTRGSISFGTLAAATYPAKGILFYRQRASAEVEADDLPIAAWDFNGTINGDGTEFKVTFNNNHSFFLFV